MKHITDQIKQQDAYFRTGVTKSITFRKNVLRDLRRVIIDREKDILDALYKDLAKPKFEAYTAEIGMVIRELDYFIDHLSSLSKPKRMQSSILNFPSKEYIYNDPYGRVLIIAPWNYPFQLTITPLIGAVAAGNCVICKPSELSKNTSKLLSSIIDEVFNKSHVYLVAGGIEESSYLLEQKWDLIFFTGSTKVGKIVLSKAAENLCPVVLELGGKSPVIVNHDSNIAQAAKSIIWAKIFNAGQTCIAPDYVYVDYRCKDKLITCLAKEIENALGENPKVSPDYARIINDIHFNRLTDLLDKETLVYGGNYDAKEKYIQPSILTPKSWNDKVMKEEIFGPILPVLTFENLEELIADINTKPKPLAAYYYGAKKRDQEYFLNHLYFGGGCINDALSHITSKSMAFGGVGHSGIGSYKGKKSFDCFSHQKSILKKSVWLDLPLRYAPYKNKLALVKKLFKL